MIHYSKHFDFDLTAKDNNGRTGFELARFHGKVNVVNLIKRKMPGFA